METAKNDNNTTMRSLDRAIDILEAFTFERAEFTLKEISDTVLLPKSTVHRILAALEVRNLIYQNPENGKYRLGHKIIKMGSVAKEGLNIRKIALPEMHRLSQLSEQTCNLYIRRGYERLCIEQVEGLHYVRRYSFLGSMRPLYCGGGKSILAFESAEFQKEFFANVKLQPFTGKTPVTESALRKELVEIKKRGYSYSLGEYEDTTAAVSVPILDHTGNIVAAMTISGPVFNFGPEQVAVYSKLLQETCARLSKDLGYNF